MPHPKLSFVLRSKPSLRLLLAGCGLAVLCAVAPAISQSHATPPSKPPADSPKASAAQSKPPAEPEVPAQIELLETHVRFEVNGDSRKEVHARVQINNELGASQFARLNFDYNRSFQQVELPLLRITHTGGGTADILPSAITDQPNPAVLNAPAYQDVRVKSVRILGLGPGDLLEYRVVTTTTHHPLAPDFWLDHTFDRSGIVSHEIFELDLPVAANVQLNLRPGLPAGLMACDIGGIACATRKTYHWECNNCLDNPASAAVATECPDITLTSFASWSSLSESVVAHFLRRSIPADDVSAQGSELTRSASSDHAKLLALYEFVSQKIRTVDLRLGARGFFRRPLTDVMASGFADPEEKVSLLMALYNDAGFEAWPVLVSATNAPQDRLPSPDVFSRVLLRAGTPADFQWLDPGLEVAPFGAIQANVRGRAGLLLSPVAATLADPQALWPTIPEALPFASLQRVSIDASLDRDGTLSAKARYALRGDNELLLRVAFHQAPKDKWKDVAQLLALSDGFRGKVTSVSASDPYATKEPFTVDYEITQPKFVDWSKKPVRIPALLPLVTLPDASPKSGADAASYAIELGTPLDVQTHVTLHVPPDTAIQAPVGTSVDRDYATFSSQYSARDLTLTAERHIRFLHRQVPADRAADYAAFVRSVQNDQSQEFTLDRSASPAQATRGTSPRTPSPQP